MTQATPRSRSSGEWNRGLPQVTSVYQPIVNLDDGHPVAYEALVRGATETCLRTPGELFGWARAHGRVADWTGRVG